MKLLLFLIKNSKKTMATAIICGLLAGLLGALILSIIHAAIDPTLASTEGLKLRFILLTVLFLLVIWGSQIPLFYLSEGAVFELRLSMIRKILDSRLRYLEEVGKHKLYASLSTDIAMISNGLVIIPRIVVNAATVLGCTIYLGMVSYPVLLALLVFIAAVFVVIKFAANRATVRLTTARELGDTLFGQFKDVTEGIKELKLHAARRESFLESELRPTAAAYKSERIRALTLLEIAGGFGQIGFYTTLGLLIFVLPDLGLIEPNQLAGIVVICVYMMSPMMAIFNMINQMVPAGVALQKVEALGLGLQENLAGEDHQMKSGEPLQSLELHGVIHTYFNEREDEQFTLGPIDMKLEPGEVVFLVGGNGSGKSTLAKVITGLYAPEGGQLTLNGKNVDESNREWLRQYFSSVFTDFYLFNRFLGMESHDTEARATKYLKKLHLDKKVEIKGGELSTTELSTGQRKRLALLVTYLEDRPIYLFDEWASDQDPQFKETFYTELIPELKRLGKCVLAITHDDNYFHMADRILKLEEGKLVEAKKLLI